VIGERFYLPTEEQLGAIVEALEKPRPRPEDFPIGSTVTQNGHETEFEVVAYWRGNCVLKHAATDTTHHAPPSQLQVVRDSLVGHVYLLHFDQKLGHAQHYIGFAEHGGLFRRLAQHESGNGKASPLIRALIRDGGSFTLARSWIGTRNDERKLKNRRNAAQLCPICRGEVPAPGPITTRGAAS
jgi:hypothetical protein